jgi:hypothetical protein
LITKAIFEILKISQHVQYHWVIVMQIQYHQKNWTHHKYCPSGNPVKEEEEEVESAKKERKEESPSHHHCLDSAVGEVVVSLFAIFVWKVRCIYQDSDKSFVFVLKVTK